MDSVGGMNVIANIVGMSLGKDYLQICQTKETNNPPFLCLFKYLYNAYMIITFSGYCLVLFNKMVT